MSLTLTLLTALLGLANAQVDHGAMAMCTGADCGYCPTSITTDGTGYPACVVYERDTVLGGYASAYKAVAGEDDRVVYYDIARANPGCNFIIRTPANTDDENCGYPIYAGPGGICYKGLTKATFMTQFCCGTGDCSNAGASKRDGSSSVSSAVLRDQEGNVLLPHSVGHPSSGDMMDMFMEDHGINASSVQARFAPVLKVGYDDDEALEKRRCGHYTAAGAPYSKTGGRSYPVSSYFCDSTTSFTISNSNSVSHTTTFGSSISDPWGIVSASVSFSTETSASQSSSYDFTPDPSQCGHVVWTPFFICTRGTITGCGGGPQTGEVCTAKRINSKTLDGVYHFVQTQ